MGIKIISIILVFSLLAALFMVFVTLMSEAMLMLPDSRKMELIQHTNWQQLNITTIGQFDDYIRKRSPNKSNLILGFFTGLIALILSFGLWKLKYWARIGTVIYGYFTILTGTLCFFLGTDERMASLFGRFFSIVTYTIIVYYLNRPNIKAKFAAVKNL